MNINEMIIAEFAKQDAVPPKPKVQVSVREVKWLNERRRQINAMDLEDIEWITEDGRVIPYNDKSVDDFKITGLSNIEFIELGFHDGSTIVSYDNDDPWDSGLGKQANPDPDVIEPNRCRSCKGRNLLQWNGKEYTCFTCLEELRMSGSS